MGHLYLAKISRKKCLAKLSLSSDIVKIKFILKTAPSLMLADNYLRLGKTVQLYQLVI